MVTIYELTGVGEGRPILVQEREDKSLWMETVSQSCVQPCARWMPIRATVWPPVVGYTIALTCVNYDYSGGHGWWNMNPQRYPNGGKIVRIAAIHKHTVEP